MKCERMKLLLAGSGLLLVLPILLAVAPRQAAAGECAGGYDAGHASSLACGDDGTFGGAATTYDAFSTSIGAVAYTGGVENTAVGYRSAAYVGQSTALGAHAKAGGYLGSANMYLSSGATAIGMGAEAGITGGGQNEATALGHNAQANAAYATTLGAESRANFTGSTAIGHGTATTRDNQVMVGNANNTYTLAGVNSDASKAAQAGTTYLVTADTNGNLATSTFNLSTLQNLPGRLTSAEQNIANIQTTVTNHTVAIYQQSVALNELGTTVGNHTTTLSEHSATLTDHGTRITNVENKNVEQDLALAGHQLWLTELDGRVTTNTNNIALLDNRVTSLESSFQDLRTEVSANRKEARGGTALALATAGLRYDDRPEKLSIAGGIGHFKGLTGLSFGVGYNTSDSLRFNAAISGVPENGDIGLSAGASWTLN